MKRCKSLNERREVMAPVTPCRRGWTGMSEGGLAPAWLVGLRSSPGVGVQDVLDKLHDKLPGLGS